MDLADRYRVQPKDLDLAAHDCGDTASLTEEESAKRREQDLERLDALQAQLYAAGRRSLLVVFQALDAAGKGGTMSPVMGGLNPQGVHVTSFKQPTATELAHDWLWRCQLALPARGEIGIFNRSHYEEVIVVRVHPEYLAARGIDPAEADGKKFWKHRFKDITTWERHLHRSGTQVVKFFLHVSKEEQRERFLARAGDTAKHWKFSAGDVAERGHWDAYQAAYGAALEATSTDHSPWYVIPADHKWFMRTAVAAILVDHLERMDPAFPKLSRQEKAEMREAVAKLQAE